jgi:hypothetical protein
VRTIELIANRVVNSEIADPERDIELLTKLVESDYETMTKLELGFMLNMMCEQLVRLKNRINQIEKGLIL